jgi:hypothetical protein
MIFHLLKAKARKENARRGICHPNKTAQEQEQEEEQE